MTNQGVRPRRPGGPKDFSPRREPWETKPQKEISPGRGDRMDPNACRIAPVAQPAIDAPRAARPFLPAPTRGQSQMRLTVFPRFDCPASLFSRRTGFVGAACLDSFAPSGAGLSRGGVQSHGLRHGLKSSAPAGAPTAGFSGRALPSRKPHPVTRAFRSAVLVFPCRK